MRVVVNHAADSFCGSRGNHGKTRKNTEMGLIFAEESFVIRGAVFEVYKEMGCGFLEAVYQECLEMELTEAGDCFCCAREAGAQI